MIAHQLTQWEDEIALGIVCIASHAEDYRLAFSLNKTIRTCFKNKAALIETKQKNKAFGFSVFVSQRRQNKPVAFLVDNHSVQSDVIDGQGTLFSLNPLLQRPVISSLKKWHYIMFSEDLAWCNQVKDQLVSKDILYTQTINYQTLKKNELDLLISLTYDQ
jgi:hypothetical protein